jgi:hypothetical protein
MNTNDDSEKIGVLRRADYLRIANNKDLAWEQGVKLGKLGVGVQGHNYSRSRPGRVGEPPFFSSLFRCWDMAFCFALPEL